MYGRSAGTPWTRRVMATGINAEDADGFVPRVRAVAAFKAGPLAGYPSDRELARIADVSPTTVGSWLRGKQFPQDEGKIAAVVRAIAARAAVGSVPVPSTADGTPLLDEAAIRILYRAEAKRRAEADSASVLSAQARAILDRQRPGRLLAEISDPFDLEVHRPVLLEEQPEDLPSLPRYVSRAHDAELARGTREAIEGRSSVLVLVGGSSTGKTRACWEALDQLRSLEPAWRLWHPIDPSRPDAALRELGSVGPRTVVWLNEAQFYLRTADGLGERVAAGLRALLRDPGRAPVLILATLWPSYWDELTARPSTGPDPHAQARELLASHDIAVPSAFTRDDLQQVSSAGDPRLEAAAVDAEDGRVTQFLAGVPELLARYRNAPAGARAVIHTAMDARRLGMQQALPRAFLEASAPGYLTGTEWDTLPDDWLDEALTYTGKPCKGVRGPLSRLRPPPGGEQAEAAYQLADYLDQHGRHQRHALVPPPSFWVAARCAQPADLITLAAAARARGLYRFGAQLLKSAASRGDPSAGADLITILHDLHPGDHRPAQWVIGDITVDLDDPHGVTMMLERLLKVDAQDLIAALLARNPATHVALHDVLGATVLLGRLQEVGAQEQATTLANRAAKHAPLDDLVDVALLLGRLLEAGAREQATTLADRAAKHAPLDDPNGVALLLDQLLEAGARDPVTALLARNPAAHFSLDHPGGIESLLHTLRRMGAQEQLAMLADRAADVLLDDPGRVASLLGSLQEVGAREQATTLANRAAAQVSLNDPHGVAVLLYRLRTMGAQEQVTTLADRAADVSLDDPFGVAWLLDGLRWADAHDQATALTHRVSHVSLDDPWGVAVLLGKLQEEGAQDLITALLARNPALHAALDDPGSVAMLLDWLRDAGAHEQVTALSDRAANVSLSTIASTAPGRAGQLLYSLRKAGAQDHATLLIDRLPSEGLFEVFCWQGRHQATYRFGRNPGGSPAKSWNWEDLD